MPQIDHTPKLWKRGQIASSVISNLISRIVELLAQVTEITLTGTGAAGDYSILVEGPDGLSVEVTYTSPGETNTQIATALFNSWNDDPVAAGVAVATNPSAGVVLLTFLRTGSTYSVSTTLFAGSSMIVEDQAPGGQSLPVGIVVARGTLAGTAARVAAATVDDNLLGFVVQSGQSQVNPGSTYGDSGVDEFLPGQTSSILDVGECIAFAEEAVVEGEDVFVRTQNPATGDPVGLLGNDADGGDRIAMTGARFAETTTARGLVRVRVNRP